MEHDEEGRGLCSSWSFPRVILPPFALRTFLLHIIPAAIGTAMYHLLNDLTKPKIHLQPLSSKQGMQIAAFPREDRV